MIEPLMRRARACGQEWKNYPFICLAISVGKQAHENDDLQAAVDLVSSMGKPCVVRVSDTIQKHNFMSNGIDEAHAETLARNAGTDWLASNEDRLYKMSVPIEIVRWDQVTNQPNFDAVHADFIRLSTQNELLASTLRRDVEKFLSRRSFSSEANRDWAARCSRAFLIEELAGQTLLGRQYSYARLYPGKPAECLELVRNGNINEAPKGLENTAFVRYNLKTCHAPSHNGQHISYKIAACG